MSSRPSHAMLLIALLAGTATAQDAVEAPTETKQSPLSVTLTLSGSHAGKADFDDATGSLSITRLGAALGIGYKLSDKASLQIGMSAEHSHYDFSSSTNLIAGTSEPFDDILIARFSAGLDFAIDDSRSWFVNGFITSSGESGADFDDTITGGGMVGYVHTFNEKLTLGVGVIGSSRLEDDFLVFPVPIIRWQVAEKLVLATGQGASVSLTYQPSQTWAVGVEGGWERREFRLDKDGPVPSGIALDSRIPLGVFARFTPNQNFIIGGRVGAHLGSNLEISNAQGRKIVEDDLDPAIYFGLDLTVRF